MTRSHDAPWHADTAARLLDGTAVMSERLERMTEDEKLKMAVTGGFTQVNNDLRWTVELAIAHALTALALDVTEQRSE